MVDIIIAQTTVVVEAVLEVIDLLLAESLLEVEPLQKVHWPQFLDNS